MSIKFNSDSKAQCRFIQQK